jgi:hypothetical protein
MAEMTGRDASKVRGRLRELCHVICSPTYPHNPVRRYRGKGRKQEKSSHPLCRRHKFTLESSLHTRLVFTHYIPYTHHDALIPPHRYRRRP